MFAPFAPGYAQEPDRALRASFKDHASSSFGAPSLPNVKFLADDVLEATVVLSFTDLGPQIRRRLFDWEALDDLRMDGRVVLITGASSGLGLASAAQLARMGATLRLLVRDPAKGERARADIVSQTPGADVSLYLADMSDLRSVRAALQTFMEAEQRLDVLINNAGALLPERRVSVDGLEMTFATMVLGPFVLTNGLFPLLSRTAAGGERARVINVASGGMYTQRLHLDDLQMEHEPYRGSVAYARAKRAQVTLSGLWAHRWRDADVVVHAMHPGWADTPGIEVSLPRFHRLVGSRLRTVEEGADTIVWLAASKDAVRSTGRFWLDRRSRPTQRLPGTGASDEEAERLWDECERLSSEPMHPSPN
jgi:NAD(P)-dependent dehydrogenase (short-subunit alcohol dehydrogenase family)